MLFQNHIFFLLKNTKGVILQNVQAALFHSMKELEKASKQFLFIRHDIQAMIKLYNGQTEMQNAQHFQIVFVSIKTFRLKKQCAIFGLNDIQLVQVSYGWSHYFNNFSWQKGEWDLETIWAVLLCFVHFGAWPRYFTAWTFFKYPVLVFYSRSEMNSMRASFKIESSSLSEWTGCV